MMKQLALVFAMLAVIASTYQIVIPDENDVWRFRRMRL